MKRLVLLFLLLWGAFGSYAQETLRDTLDAVSVTDMAIRHLVPVQALDSSSLERLSSRSVADALRLFSGVSIKDYGGLGGLKTVNVRSLGTQHVGVFYDGVKIHNAQNGQVDLGRFSLDNMESVSLYNGQKCESLQSAAEYASASSVYLRTRVPVFGDRNSNLRARICYASFGTVNPSLRLEQRLKHIALSSEVSYLSSRGDYPFVIEDNGSRRTNGDISALRAEAALFARPFGGDFQVHAYYYRSDRGLPGPVIRRLSNLYSSRDRQMDDNAFLQLAWKRIWDKAALRFNAKGSLDWLEYISGTGTAPQTDNHFFQKDFYGSAAAALYPLRCLSLSFAFDERWSDLICDVKHYNYVQRFDTRSAFAANVHSGGFSVQMSLLHTFIRDITRRAAAPLSKLTPSFSAGWTSNGLSIRGFYKSIFRAPTLNDLYYTLVGNPDLKPEYARQLDLGADYEFKTPDYVLKASADLYCNEIENKIVAMPSGSQFRWSMLNFGRVRGYGLDVSLNQSLKLGETRLGLLSSYSYEVARDVTDKSSEYFGGQIPYTPWHSFSLVADCEWKKWTACASWLWTGVRYTASDNLPASRLRPWTTLDLSMSRRFDLAGTRVLAGLDVNNLLNRQYELVSRYPMPGLNVMLKLTLTI